MFYRGCEDTAVISDPTVVGIERNGPRMAPRKRFFGQCIRKSCSDSKVPHTKVVRRAEG